MDNEYNYTIHKNKFGKYAVPVEVDHRPCVKTIKSSQVWEPNTIKFICENIKNLNMVHAGTFFGDMIPAFSKSTAGNIYAFEANTENAFCAEKTILLNDLKNVILTKKGLGQKKEKKEFITSLKKNEQFIKAGGSGSFLLPESEYITETAEITTIDSVVDGHISIIQLDIEGYEINALKGAVNTIRKYKPILVLETIDPSDNFFKENIISLGYKFKKEIEKNKVWMV